MFLFFKKKDSINTNLTRKINNFKNNVLKAEQDEKKIKI
jgi:hypothetical protein